MGYIHCKYSCLLTINASTLNTTVTTAAIAITTYAASSSMHQHRHIC